MGQEIEDTDNISQKPGCLLLPTGLVVYMFEWTMVVFWAVSVHSNVKCANYMYDSVN